jgi:hypothetical protein
VDSQALAQTTPETMTAVHFIFRRSLSYVPSRLSLPSALRNHYAQSHDFEQGVPGHWLSAANRGISQHELQQMFRDDAARLRSFPVGLQRPDESK